MAVSKRLRYEILRRDDHTCRYCGGKAPDVALTVDHVQPTALGGSDLPENLVAACKDCNAGKSSVKPDDHLVAEVSEDAKKWHARMRYAMDQIENDLIMRSIERDNFEGIWNGYTIRGEPIPLPLDWRRTVDHWASLGVPTIALAEAIQIAMAKAGLQAADRWKYARGVVWRTVDKARTAAELTVESEPEEDTEDDDYSEQNYFQEQMAKHYNRGFEDARQWLECADVPTRWGLWRLVDGRLGPTDHYLPAQKAVA